MPIHILHSSQGLQFTIKGIMIIFKALVLKKESLDSILAPFLYSCTSRVCRERIEATSSESQTRRRYKV